MWLLVITIYGLVVLCTGQLYVSNQLVARGWQARLIGLIGMMAFPVAFLSGTVIGIVIVIYNPGMVVDPKSWMFTLLELAVIGICVGLTMLLGYGVADNQRRMRQWHNECDDLEDDYHDAVEAAKRQTEETTFEPVEPIAVTCPGCSVRLKLPANFSGPRVRCPKCQTVIDVPIANPSSVTATPSAPLARPTPAPKPPVYPDRPTLRGPIWFIGWTALAILAIVVPTFAVAFYMAFDEPIPVARDVNPPPPKKAPWMGERKVLNDKDDPNWGAAKKVPIVDEKKWPSDPPKTLEKKSDPPFGTESKDSRGPGVLKLVHDRETPPWMVGQFQSDHHPSLPYNGHLWVSFANGETELVSRLNARRMNGFKADRPLGVLSATSAGLIGQSVDPEDPTTNSGDIFGWRVVLRKTNEPQEPTYSIPFKGSINRFIFRDYQTAWFDFFLDTKQNRVGAIETKARRIAKLEPVKTPGARVFAMSHNFLYVVCGDNSIEKIRASDLSLVAQFQIPGITIKDLAARRDDALLYLVADPQPGDAKTGPATNCFAVDLNRVKLDGPIKATPIEIDHPCHTVEQGRGVFFIGEKKITTCTISAVAPLRKTLWRTFDLRTPLPRGRVALSPDDRLLALPTGEILNIEY